MKVFLPPAKFLDLVSDASSADTWWMEGAPCPPPPWQELDGNEETWGVLVHEGIAYTVSLGIESAIVGVARFTAEMGEAE